MAWTAVSWFAESIVKLYIMSGNVFTCSPVPFGMASLEERHA